MQRVRSRTEQNEMRDAQGTWTTGAAQRTLNSANSSEIRVQQKAVSGEAKTGRISVTRKHKLFSGC